MANWNLVFLICACGTYGGIYPPLDCQKQDCPALSRAPKVRRTGQSHLEIAEMYNISKIDKNRFMNCYEKNIKTIYDSAERNGFKADWEYK